MPEIAPEFYVGYQPKAPPGLARGLRWIVCALLSLAVGLAFLLVRAQSPFPPSRFEFLEYKPYQGTLVEWPYPFLTVDGRDYLLVGAGKHGAAREVTGLGGRNVALRGALIEYGESRALEVEAGSARSVGEAGHAPETLNFGAVSLSGEIVDTKCYFGVMNPGRGKVHRDCAARCLSGGIPPGLVVRDSDGLSRVVLLANQEGRPLGREVLSFAGELVSIAGELTRTGATMVLKVDPARFRRE